MGGADKVERQHHFGKLTVRERIDELVDPGTFHEIGAIAGKQVLQVDGTRRFQPANFVMGRAQLDGRPIVVGGDDFTVRGGASDASIAAKQVMAEQLANEYRVPIVRLVDGTGGGGSIKSLEESGYTYIPANPGWEWVVANLATVPVVSLALGSVAGLGAARVVASHYSLMVRDISQVFVAGPPLVAHLGETVTKEELGGAHIHGHNGTVSDVVASEHEAFERTRQFLSYLPSSVDELAERTEPDDDPERREDWLIGAIPRNRRQGYAIRPIIEAVVDRHSWFEIGAGWGRSAVTGLGPARRLAGGRAVVGPDVLRRRAHRRLVDEDGGVRRARRHVPPARRAPRRPAGLRHRRRGRAGGDDPPRRPGPRRRVPGPGAVVLGHPAAGVRRRRGRPLRPHPRRASAPPGRRVTGARCRWRAASRPPTAPSSRRRPIPVGCGPRSTRR